MVARVRIGCNLEQDHHWQPDRQARWKYSVDKINNSFLIGNESVFTGPNNVGTLM